MFAMPVALLNNEGEGVDIEDLDVLLLPSESPLLSCLGFFSRSFVLEKDLNILMRGDQ